ncbi:hypothetical protein EYZ11_012969 [Aspergillus tanneri]|uniref:Uncharacterized protein n=1 Tax=Aspergillus tanneri TaxID=1220188 RepID=A0A4S3J102_9EURO|nr:hypothetical protein EYZ11_012969 [Aspergillus tanneri]
MHMRNIENSISELPPQDQSFRERSKERLQTVKHVLLECLLHTVVRKEVLNRIAAHRIQVHTSGYDALMSNPQAIRYMPNSWGCSASSNT